MSDNPQVTNGSLLSKQHLSQHNVFCHLPSINELLQLLFSCPQTTNLLQDLRSYCADTCLGGRRIKYKALLFTLKHNWAVGV